MTNTSEEQKTILETQNHIDNVNNLINLFVQELIKNVKNHDNSKLNEPELSGFVKATKRLSSCTYGNEEYKQSLEELKPTLEHHYSNNNHHPEHFSNGVNDMTLLNLVEMFFDWKAATFRTANGNLSKSIDINAGRFKLDKQLVDIFQNTAKLYERTVKI